jgi:hypothetical protein
LLIFLLLGEKMDIQKLKQIALVKKVKLINLKMQGLISAEVANALNRILDEIIMNYSEEVLLTKLYDYLRGVVALYDAKQIDSNVFGELMISENELVEILR